MSADPQSRAPASSRQEAIVWICACGCGRIRGVFEHAADASQPPALGGCGNCGDLQRHVSPARLAGNALVIRVCSSCATIVYEPPLEGAPPRCPRCGADSLVERLFELPARLSPAVRS
jgi:hypothetical protein